jgi:hypothetical protein
MTEEEEEEEEERKFICLQQNTHLYSTKYKFGNAEVYSTELCV